MFKLKIFFHLQFLVEENETINKEKLQEDYNDAYPFYLFWFGDFFLVLFDSVNC